MADDYPADSSVVSDQLGKVTMMKIAASKYTDRTDDESSIFLELGSHIDSPVVGRMARISEKTGRTASVSGFTDRIGKPIKVEVVTAALVYDCERTGKSYLLIIKNTLHVPNMDTCLIHPIMIRINQMEVDKNPKFLSQAPNEKNHSIFIDEFDLCILLKLDGVISYVPC